jgi:hypothetical protein
MEHFLEVPFELCSLEKFKARSWTLLITCPGVFLCGFLWSGFSYGCGCGTDSACFYFSTGFGSGVGAWLGHILTSVSFENGMPTVPRQELFHAFAYFTAIFFGSGTTWQRIVNDTKDYNMDFNEAFLFVWLMSFLLFLTVLTILRCLNTLLRKRTHMEEVLQIEDDFQTATRRFYFDIQLACSIGFADACFVGTVSGYYGDNWLGPVFGIQSSTHVLEGMVKSGASTLVGFAVAQCVQNVFMRLAWLDPAEHIGLTPSSSKVSLHGGSSSKHGLPADSDTGTDGSPTPPPTMDVINSMHEVKSATDSPLQASSHGSSPV